MSSRFERMIRRVTAVARAASKPASTAIVITISSATGTIEGPAHRCPSASASKTFAAPADSALIWTTLTGS